MDIPAVVKGYELTNPDKVRRALEGAPNRTGESVGGIANPDGTYDEDLLLAVYDKMGGGIRNANGDIVKGGSFYDFKAKKPREKAEVVLTFRINGSIVDVTEEDEAPAIVKAAKTLAKQAKEIVEKPKKK
jgi:hypothetical protein